jgi:nucleoside 2-deoxyribosyltransferase
MTKQFKGYLASHFFNEAGLKWTEEVATEIEDYVGIELYVPHRNAEINDKTNDEDITAVKIANADSEKLREANVLIACLDGVEIDAGVASEIGYFAALKEQDDATNSEHLRTIVGVYTDMRRDGTGDNRFYINLYTKGLVEYHGHIVNSTKELIEYLIQLEDEFELINSEE